MTTLEQMIIELTTADQTRRNQIFEDISNNFTLVNDFSDLLLLVEKFPEYNDRLFQLVNEHFGRLVRTAEEVLILNQRLFNQHSAEILASLMMPNNFSEIVKSRGQALLLAVISPDILRRFNENQAQVSRNPQSFLAAAQERRDHDEPDEGIGKGSQP